MAWPPNAPVVDSARSSPRMFEIALQRRSLLLDRETWKGCAYDGVFQSGARAGQSVGDIP
jgi:hypothetical protein